MVMLAKACLCKNQFRELAINGIDSRIAGGGSMEIFNELSAPFTRKAACWAFGVLGMSALTAASDDSDKPATLVTPDIVLMATHYFPADSATLTFVSEDGSDTNLTRTITAHVNLGPGLSGDGGDITVGRLSSVLPASVRPLRLGVANLTSYLPPVLTGESWMIPVMENTGAQLATVSNWVSMPDNAPPNNNLLGVNAAFTAPRSSYYVDKVAGDSGHGCGMIVSGELISLMALSYASGGGTGWANWKYLDAITAAIATLGSATSLSLFDPATL